MRHERPSSRNRWRPFRCDPQVPRTRLRGSLTSSTVDHSRRPPMKAAVFSIVFLLASLTSLTAADNEQRPRLQIFNGSTQTVDIAWLKTEADRVPNGSIAPGENTIITT